MQHDELIWQVIAHTHCSFRSKYVVAVRRLDGCQLMLMARHIAGWARRRLSAETSTA